MFSDHGERDAEFRSDPQINFMDMKLLFVFPYDA